MVYLFLLFFKSFIYLFIVFFLLISNYRILSGGFFKNIIQETFSLDCPNDLVKYDVVHHSILRIQKI